MVDLLRKRWFQVLGTIVLLVSFSIVYYKFIKAPSKPESTNIVADVCGDKITRLEFKISERREAQRIYQSEGMLRGSDNFSIRLAVFRSLFNDKVLDRLSRKYEIIVKPEEIDERILQIKKQLDHPNKEYAFSLFLDMGGYGNGPEGLERLREDLRLEIIEQKLMDKIFPLTSPEFNVSDQELKDFIPKVQLQQIFFAVNPSASLKNDINEATDKMMDRANEVYIQAQSGVDFGDLAVTYSQEPQAASRGYVGWVSKGIVTPKFWENVENLDAGQITRPFTTEAGIHIVKCINTTQEGEEIYNTYKDVIKFRLQFRKQKSRFNAWFAEQLTDLRDKGCVKVFDHYLKAVKSEAEGDVETAIAELKLAAAEDTQNPYYRIKIGEMYSKQNKTQEALGEFRKATEMAPRDPYVFFRLGEAYMGYGDLEKSMREFNKASDLARLDPEIHRRLEAIYTNLGLLKESTEEHRRWMHAVSLRTPSKTQQQIQQLLPGQEPQPEDPGTLMPDFSTPMPSDTELPDLRPPETP